MSHNPKSDAKLRVPLDTKAKDLLLQVIDTIVLDMRERISTGTPGPSNLDAESAYQLICKGILDIRLSNSNPPRPEFVVVP